MVSLPAVEKKHSSHFTDNLQLLIREELQKYRVINGVWFGICPPTVEWLDVDLLMSNPG